LMSVKETLAHIAMGALSGFFSWINPVITCILVVLFIVYQVFDYIETRDRPSRQMIEFALGYVVASLGFFIGLGL